MKILEVEIQKIRGIANAKIPVDGENLVLYGSNGSGKSAVIDAIDFLLTGRISRLLGRGTKDISLLKHGPHIGFSADEAKVTAKVILPSGKETLLERSISKPQTLIHDASVDSELLPILEVAQKGQYVLSRKEILNFIASEGSTRAEQMQSLLKLEGLDTIRKALNSTKNHLKSNSQSENSSLQLARNKVATLIGERTYSENKFIEWINSNRSKFAAAEIPKLDPTLIKSGVTFESPATANYEQIKTSVRKCIALLGAEATKRISDLVVRMEQQFLSLSSDKELFKLIRCEHVTERSLTLLDGSGECPVCGAKWDPQKLNEIMSTRLEGAKRAKQIQTGFDSQASEVSTKIASVLNEIQFILNNAAAFDMEGKLDLLENWKQNLEIRYKDLTDPINAYQRILSDKESFKRLYSPEGIGDLLENIEKDLDKKTVAPTPLIDAWTNLTRAEENASALVSAELRAEQAQKAYKRAELLLSTFELHRETTLAALFNSISSRFAELYKDLHGPDESDFKAVLKPAGAVVKFEVDFHGMGMFPPNAVHSEGHQDSMGICLYLALVEYLNKDQIQFVLLDDVVMSVDSGHRKELCRMLKTHFPDRQFIITTHDKAWSRQMQHEGVVKINYLIELNNWKLGSGPTMRKSEDTWEKVDQCLTENNVNEAAPLVRRHLEDVFSNICDNLQAMVRFRLAGSYTLGDLVDPAYSKYRSLTKEAIKSARSWEDEDLAQELEEFLSTIEQAYRNTKVEDWALNPAVHYNTWEDFQKQDFEGVVTAFKGLEQVFKCAACNSFVTTVVSGAKIVGVKCNCGKINWNLTSK